MKERDRTRVRGVSWWLKRILGGLAVLFLGLILSGALYQVVVARYDRTHLGPPGELIDVGGRRLHLYCVGTGSPAVVLEAGLGDNWLTWSLVQEQLGELTQVCAYDRAGLGWSDPAPEPLSSAQVAASLHTLLHEAAIPGPYVLVGHSIGGIYARSFAHQYPAEVAGLVLVDSSHENQMVRFPAEIVEAAKKDMAALSGSLALCRSLAPLGLVRILGLMDATAASKPLPAEQQQMLLATISRTSYCRAVGDELAMAYQVDTNQQDPPPPLGDIPLTILTVPVDPPAGSAEVYSQADRIAVELREELAGLSSHSRQVIVTESGHYIQFDRPDAVIEAVREMVQAVR